MTRSDEPIASCRMLVEASPANLAKEVLKHLSSAEDQRALEGVFANLHSSLRQDASSQAATAVAELLTRKNEIREK